MLDAMSTPPTPNQAAHLDDIPTICAISVIACMFSTMMHEGIGHAATAIFTLHASGTLCTLAWSSLQGSRLVEAGGTLVNLATGLICWLLLRAARNASPTRRFFLLITMSFNLLAGTGYFFFSGVSNFGDWAMVIQGLEPHWLFRTALIVLGIASYYGAILLIGSNLIRRMGIARNDVRGFRRLLWVPYFSAIVIDGIAGLFNPIGLQYVLLSALAATAGGNSGLLWLRHYIPKNVQPGPAQCVPRSYPWIIVAAIFAAIFIGVFGPGIHLNG